MRKRAEFLVFEGSELSLGELLEAERELGRLIEQLVGDRRHLWLDDAIRRETVASFALEGVGVSWEDLAVAHVDRALLPVWQRSDIAEPLDLALAAKAMQDLRTYAAAATATKTPAPAGSDLSELLASIRRSKTDIAEFVDRVGGAHQHAVEEPQEEVPPRPTLPPLSGPWLAAAWRHAAGESASASKMAGVAAMIEEQLEQPGLTGVALALHALHQPGTLPDPDIDGISRPLQRRTPGQHDPRGWRFVRLLAPWLLQAACRLPTPGPWVSAAFRRAGPGYLAATRSVEHWQNWLYPTFTDCFLAERRRIADLGELVDRWESRFGAGKSWRWTASQRGLQLLLAYPAVTTKFLCRERSFTLRAAQQLAKDLEDANILQRIHHAKGQEWLIAPELRI